MAGAGQDDPLRPAVPMALVRSAFPEWAHVDAPDAAIAALVADGGLEAAEGGVRTPGFEVTMSTDQERAAAELMAALGGGGLAAPMLDELPDGLRGRQDLKALVRWLESADRIRSVADGLWIPTAELDTAAERIRAELAGRTGLGPADFREVLPVTRRHLIPLLNYFDGVGTTRRGPDGARDVPEGG